MQKLLRTDKKFAVFIKVCIGSLKYVGIEVELVKIRISRECFKMSFIILWSNFQVGVESNARLLGFCFNLSCDWPETRAIWLSASSRAFRF